MENRKQELFTNAMQLLKGHDPVAEYNYFDSLACYGNSHVLDGLSNAIVAALDLWSNGTMVAHLTSDPTADVYKCLTG
ncbi:hypothetical protein C5167_032450 [Papaver somniferum]|uniref:Uncharacterized protein n=1 Tax=Papaver somniferum TaxID=3469 RepID=A0A4Y7K8S1_PAPSO|nr:hypothetical protein C5167_032450 [Papaver somniferum]